MKKETEYFLAAAETGSITKAAEKIYVGQPAVSRGIAALEKSLGVQLFVRTAAGVTLTEAGRIYEKYARYTSQVEREMKQSLDTVRMRKKHVIPVAMTLNASIFSGDRINRTVEETASSFYLRIDNLLTRDMVRGLREGTYRYAVCPENILQGEKDIHCTKIFANGWLLITPKERDLSGYLNVEGRMPLVPEVQERGQLIVQDQGTDIRREIDLLFREYDLSIPEDTQSVANSMLGIQKAEDGDGSLIISENLRFLVNEDKVNVYRIAAEYRTVTVLAYLNSLRFLPGERDCIDTMCRIICEENTRG